MHTAGPDARSALTRVREEWHQLIGKWNSNEKTIVWNNKSGDYVFTGSSDFSEKQNIKEAFSIYIDGTQVFSVTAELKAEAK